MSIKQINIPKSPRRLGSDHPDVAKSLNNLANLYSDQGRYEQAKPLYQQALQIATQKLGEKHPNTLNILSNFQDLLEKRREEQE